MAQQSSGQITVTTAGTAVPGPAVGPGEFILQPGSGNAGAKVFIGNDGSNDVSSATGFSLAAGDKVVITVKTLASVYFDVSTNGDKIEWLFCTRHAGGTYGLAID